MGTTEGLFFFKIHYQVEYCEFVTNCLIERQTSVSLELKTCFFFFLSLIAQRGLKSFQISCIGYGDPF